MVNGTLLQRIRNLETEYYNALSSRVTLLETTIIDKISQLEAKLSKQLNDLQLSFTQQLSELQSSNIDAVIAQLQSDWQVKLDAAKLELSSKIQDRDQAIRNLQNLNKLWRKNFRIVNSSIAMIRKNINRLSPSQG
jgi:replication-associated recombination protein RarA